MSQLPDIFDSWRQAIVSELDSRLRTLRVPFGAVHDLGPDAADRLSRFASGGKLIRGALVRLGALFESSTDRSAAAVEAGAAIELFQSALLVHDDIMDRDERRRGEDSVYRQYELMAETERIGDSLHIGESLGICAGDIAFFVAFEILARLPVPDAVRSRVVALCARELQYVGVAQMADVFRGAKPVTVASGDELETTLRVYLYKTGRYTFSLPLMVGAIISGAPESTVERLSLIGEKLGVLFQLKDDEIGLYGSEEETGKPVGSDIREGKKTVYFAELFRGASDDQRAWLSGVYGNPEAGEAEIDRVRSLIESSGVRERVARRMADYAAEAAGLIAGLTGVDDEAKRILVALHEFNTGRTK
jgi:geranylgeranyl diphosphate synthase, type I